MLVVSLVKNKKRTLKIFGSPFFDKARKLYVFENEMILLGKHSCVSIEHADDATAVYYFLQWLHTQRDAANKNIRDRDCQRDGFSKP